MTPGERSLSDWIRSEIGRDGPMPFRRFMELALYHEQWGYYRRGRDPFGVAGDYFTNSQLQPVFGRLVSQQIDRWRGEIGAASGFSHGEFSIVELGSGRGETLQALGDRLPGAHCVSVEHARPRALPEHFSGVVFSNEFFDALPVHSVAKKGDGIVEHYVDVTEQGFRFVDGAPSDPRIEEYLERYVPGLAEGRQIEVNLAALEYLERTAAALDRGYVLTIDYGYTAEEITRGGRFPRGSLMSYVKHQASEDVLADPGNRDITAHVNFTALERRGEELGLVSDGLRTQAQFLMAVGEIDQFAAALEAGDETQSLQLRLQLKTLVFGLGETFRVLVQRKL